MNLRLDSYKQRLYRINDESFTIDKSKFFKNLTQTHILDYIIDVISLGNKFCPYTKLNTTNAKEIIECIEHSIKSAKKDEDDPEAIRIEIRNKLVRCIRIHSLHFSRIAFHECSFSGMTIYTNGYFHEWPFSRMVIFTNALIHENFFYFR